MIVIIENLTHIPPCLLQSNNHHKVTGYSEMGTFFCGGLLEKQAFLKFAVSVKKIKKK